MNIKKTLKTIAKVTAYQAGATLGHSLLAVSTAVSAATNVITVPLVTLGGDSAIKGLDAGANGGFVEGFKQPFRTIIQDQLRKCNELDSKVEA